MEKYSDDENAWAQGRGRGTQNEYIHVSSNLAINEITRVSNKTIRRMNFNLIL